MADKIKLLPLPEPRPYAFLPHEVLARDIEVARVVLEAAAELVHTEYLDAFLFGTKDASTLQELERSIRNLEVSHE